MRETVEIDRETLAALVGYVASQLRDIRTTDGFDTAIHIAFSDEKSGTRCGLSISKDRFEELLDQSGIRMWWDNWKRGSAKTDTAKVDQSGLMYSPFDASQHIPVGTTNSSGGK